MEEGLRQSKANMIIGQVPQFTSNSKWVEEADYNLSGHQDLVTCHGHQDLVTCHGLDLVTCHGLDLVTCHGLDLVMVTKTLSICIGAM